MKKFTKIMLTCFLLVFSFHINTKATEWGDTSAIQDVTINGENFTIVTENAAINVATTINNDLIVSHQATLTINSSLTVYGNVYVYGHILHNGTIMISETLKVHNFKNFAFSGANTSYGTFLGNGGGTIKSIVVQNLKYREIPVEMVTYDSQNSLLYGRTFPANQLVINGQSTAMSKNGEFTFPLASSQDITGTVTDIFGFSSTFTYSKNQIDEIDPVFQMEKLVSIEMSSLPSKINYLYSEQIDTTSGMIRANKVSGEFVEIPLSLDMLSGYDPYSSVYGPQTVTVTYQGLTSTFEVYLNRFSDVPYGHRNYVHINALVGLGIINGYSDNTFRPSNTLTRAQAAIMIVRAIGLSTEEVSSSFTDVPPTHAAYKFISAAYQAGIINGYSDGTFRPNANVTRAQIAIMVQRAFNVQASDTIITFTDVPEGYAPKKFIETLASQKIVNGYSDGTFKPLNNVTRAQFSTMIYNAIQYAQKTE
jgi:hypothetical protein